MNVLFKLNRNLIDVVDNIGLDWDIVNNNIEVLLEEVEFFIDSIDDLNRLTDSELCEYLLNPVLCEGLINAVRIYD